MFKDNLGLFVKLVLLVLALPFIIVAANVALLWWLIRGMFILIKNFYKSEK